MASKRQRKKQETKKKRLLAVSESKTKKERKQAKKARGQELERLYKKKEQNKKNRERLQGYRREAERWGLEKPSQYKSRKSLDKAIAAQKRKIKREEKRIEKLNKRAESVRGLTLFVFWTDKEGHDLEEWYTQRTEVEDTYDGGGETKQEKMMTLKKYIIDMLNDKYGVAAGEYEIKHSDQGQAMDLIRFSQAYGFNEVYGGTCSYLLPLMKMTATMMTCIYDPQHKRAFIRELAEKVHIFNEEFAIEISNLNKNIIGYDKDGGVIRYVGQNVM